MRPPREDGTVVRRDSGVSAVRWAGHRHSHLGGLAAGMTALMRGVTLIIAAGKCRLMRRISRDPNRVKVCAGVLLALAGVVQIYLSRFDFDWLGIFRLRGS